MQYFFYQITLLILLCFSSFVYAQKPDFKILKKKAETFYSNRNFNEALKSYSSLYSLVKKDKAVVYYIARSYFHLNRFTEALPYFKEYLKYKTHKVDAIFYTALCLHQIKKYKEAASLYRQYLKKSKNPNPLREEAKRRLLQAVSVEKQVRKDAFFIMQGQSDSINSTHNDYLPVYNRREENSIFFSSDRGGSEGIYKTRTENGNYQNTIELAGRYNSENNEILISFPDSAYQIMYLREGRIFIDNYKDNSDEALNLDVLGRKFKYNIKDCYLFSEKLLVFSSDMPGGYGGLDIYASLRHENGIWSDIINLGPKINSVFNERSPFVALDGSIFYSSDRPESIGGYDVYSFCLFDNDSKVLPFNTPLNSEGDDLFFRIEADGSQAWLSSVRNGGAGQFDIYKFLFKSDDRIFLPEEIIKKIISLCNNSEKKSLDSVFKIPSIYDIYVDLENFSLRPGQEMEISKLVDFLKNNPDVYIVLSGHCAAGTDLPLLISYKGAELVSEILFNSGVSMERIHLRGCSDIYPKAKNQQFDGSPNIMGRTLNNRVEVVMILNDKIINKNNNEMISPVLTDNTFQKYLELQEGLEFRVQLTEIDEIGKNKAILSLQNTAIEKKLNSLNLTYTVGSSRNFDAIKIILETVLEEGFRNAKIVAYFNGFPITLKESIRLSESYPELKKYLGYIESK